MGTTTTYLSNTSTKGIKAWFLSYLTWNSETHDYLTLDIAKVGGKLYGKVERTERATGERDVFIVIAVVSVYGSDCENFSYKTMDETEGPFVYDCPLRLIDGLPEPASKYARDWRESVRRYHATKPRQTKVGDRIKFDSPLKFSDGTEHDTFTVHSGGRRRSRIYRSDRGFNYRISGIGRLKYNILNR